MNTQSERPTASHFAVGPVEPPRSQPLCSATPRQRVLSGCCMQCWAEGERRPAIPGDGVCLECAS